MRELDKPEDNGLGPKIVKPEMPKPNVKVGKGIWKAPDGKLYTSIPQPPPEPTLFDLLKRAGMP